LNDSGLPRSPNLDRQTHTHKERERERERERETDRHRDREVSRRDIPGGGNIYNGGQN